ncbi:hypothetical protein ES703_108868 [subsurface metagenome]
MPGPEQKIKTVLIPEHGLELSPEFIEQSIVSPDFSRVFAHLIGKADDRGILIRATSDGSLRVVSAGVPFEYYIIKSGISVDAFHADDTFEFSIAYNVTDFLIETHPAIISFRNQFGVWLPEKILVVGYHSIDFINYGVRIRNRNPGSNSVYEITSYR